MKKLILIALLIVSCSSNDVNEEEQVYVDRCGEIVQKTIFFNNGDRLFRLTVNVFNKEGVSFKKYVTEEEYNNLEEGDTFCYGQHIE